MFLVFTVTGAGASLPSNGWRPEKLVNILYWGGRPLPTPTTKTSPVQTANSLRLGNLALQPAVQINEPQRYIST